jgi:hypothetical protein
VSVMNDQESKDTCLSDIDLLHLEVIEDIHQSLGCDKLTSMDI